MNKNVSGKSHEYQHSYPLWLLQKIAGFSDSGEYLFNKCKKEI